MIRAKVSWETSSEQEGPIFFAYYDNNQSWDQLQQFFLKKSAASRLIQELVKIPTLEISVGWQGEHIACVKQQACMLISPENLVFQETTLSVYRMPVAKLMPSYRWFNWDLEHNHSLFTWLDVYQAHLEGIQKGMAAGFQGLKSIDGKTPAECSWDYLEGNSGN